MLAHLKRQPTCLGATNGTKQKLKMSRSLQSPAAITDGKKSFPQFLTYKFSRRVWSIKNPFLSRLHTGDIHVHETSTIMHNQNSGRLIYPHISVMYFNQSGVLLPRK